MASTEETVANGAVDGSTPPEKLWEHGDPQSTPMWKFMQKLNSKYSLDLQKYHDLHAWSCENLEQFWEEVWYETGVKVSRSFDRVTSTLDMVLFLDGGGGDSGTAS
jgi:acetoacetyl-CoA synthetase